LFAVVFAVVAVMLAVVAIVSLRSATLFAAVAVD